MSEKEDIWSVLKSLVLFVLLALFLRASAFAAYKIPSSSMEDTLKVGDHIFANKLSYGFRLPFMEQTLFDYDFPERGEIVIFTLPENPSIDIIKRVVGVPGDKVEIRGKVLYLNDEPYEKDKEFTIWKEGGIKDFGPVVVPEGHILLFGDNRDHSRDSRFWDDPFLHHKRIVGRAFIIWWNWHKPMERIFTIIR